MYLLLAEALNERADAQRRLADLKQRIGDNARVHENGRPAEDPQALLHQAIEVNERIRSLGVAVMITDTATRLPDGTTVTEALAQRKALSRRMRLIAGAADRASDSLSRLGRETALLDVAALRAEADRLAAQRRALDVEIQRVNWTTELTVSV